MYNKNKAIQRALMLAGLLATLAAVPASADSAAPPIAVSISPGNATTTVNVDVNEVSTSQDLDTIDVSGGPTLFDDEVTRFKVHGGGMTVVLNLANYLETIYDDNGWRQFRFRYGLRSSTTGVYIITETLDDEPEWVDDLPKVSEYGVQVTN